MPRNVSPKVYSQVLGAQVVPAFFVQIKFTGDTVWMWSGLGTKTPPGPAYDSNSSFPYGQTFVGMGWMGQIKAIPQVGDVVAQNITLSLSGIPSELLTDAIYAVRQNSVVTVWLAFLDSNNEVLEDPVQCFLGSLDVPTITESGATCSIAITAENSLIDLNRAPSRRFTDVDQQFAHSGDIGFYQVQLLQDYNITWPWPSPPTGDYSPPNKLQVLPSTASIAVGGTVDLVCTLFNVDSSTQNVTDSTQGGWWETTDATVATVDQNGIVTGVSQGFCVVTKSWNHGEFESVDISPIVSASATITVTA